MGQSLHAFSMGSQFEAQIAHDYLADNGIGCVIRCDEIPLRPGFSFGLEGWGSLLVQAHDALEARELLALIPGVAHADDECSEETPSVSGAFQLQFPSVFALGYICFVWFLAWEIVWFVPGTPEWIWVIGVLPLAISGVSLTLFLIFLTNGRLLFRELKRAMLAFLALIVLVVLSPILIAPLLFMWSKLAFVRLRKTFNWLANLPEHLSD